MSPHKVENDHNERRDYDRSHGEGRDQNHCEGCPSACEFLLQHGREYSIRKRTGNVSWFSKGLKGIGHLAEKAAPYVGLIPGVGTVAGGLIGAAGGLAAGDGLGGALKYGVQGAAGGMAGGGLRSAVTGAITGHGGSPTPSPGVTDPSDPNFDMNTLYGSDTAPDSGGGGGIGGVLRNAVGGGTGQPQGTSTNPWLLGLAGLQGANSAYLGQKSNALSDKALKGIEANYAERAPLRAAGLRGLLNPTAPDTSQLYSIQQRNPYAAPPRSPAQLPLAS